jgi:hypothetical protein
MKKTYIAPAAEAVDVKFELMKGGSPYNRLRNEAYEISVAPEDYEEEEIEDAV